MKRLTKLLIASAALSALSACGLQGDLQRPDPLWGTPDAREAAQLPDRRVDEGIDDELRTDTGQEEPDPEEELLGGPGGV